LSQVEAIDIFIETDPEAGGEEGTGLISVRVPYEREFARQIKELGAKWDDQTKEWRLYGGEDLIKQVAELCKSVFPGLPRRRNRLVTTRLTTSEGQSRPSEGQANIKEVELVARVEFLVNRTLKNYRVGQNLKWVKEFKQTIELPLNEGSGENSTVAQQEQFAKSLRASLPELERSATSAFEALLIGRKEVVKAILNEAGIEQK
jgi:hypothetical protein